MLTTTERCTHRLRVKASRPAHDIGRRRAGVAHDLHGPSRVEDLMLGLVKTLDKLSKRLEEAVENSVLDVQDLGFFDRVLLVRLVL